MPYKDLEKRNEYHREYYKNYMRDHIEYRLTSENNRKKNMEDWKKDGIITYKFRRLTKKYGKLGAEVFLRDNCACVKCGETDFRVLVLDHILPKSKGGKDEYNNLQTLCSSCHSIKHFMEDIPNVNKPTVEEYDKHWMLFAKSLSKYSRCLSRKIGGVLVKDGKVLSIGTNGPPRGVSTCDNRWFLDQDFNNKYSEGIDLSKVKGKCPRQVIGFKSGEGLDICIAVHTEVACILSAGSQGKATRGADLYIDCAMPCKDCMVAIITAGINRVICTKNGSDTGNFGLFYDITSKYLYDDSDLNIIFIEDNCEQN